MDSPGVIVDKAFRLLNWEPNTEDRLLALRMITRHGSMTDIKLSEMLKLVYTPDSDETPAQRRDRIRKDTLSRV